MLVRWPVEFDDLPTQYGDFTIFSETICIIDLQPGLVIEKHVKTCEMTNTFQKTVFLPCSFFS